MEEMKTWSVCPVCRKRIPAERVTENGAVYLVKTCPEHGRFSSIVWRGMQDYAAWRGPIAPVPEEKCRRCASCAGLCGIHLRNTCCVLLEVTKRCNMHCSFCFAEADSPESRRRDLNTEQLKARIFDLTIPGRTLLQLSGGEPTVREDLPELISFAVQCGCRYVQLNTNGIRLAGDPSYAKSLAEAGLSFVFLQFDGTEDRIFQTLRGAALLEKADQVIYAGSLVNPALLERCKESCRILDSARMTLEQVIAAIEEAERDGLMTVRLHTGDPSLYGAIREQMDMLDRLSVPYDMTPGVSSFSAAAASLQAEYTLPGLSQTLILTRMAGRTPVPEREALDRLAKAGASMALFLSAGMSEEVQTALLKGAYTADTPAAIVYKASWPEEKVLRCTVGTLAETAREAGISKTALILVGDFLDADFERSRLYAPDFTTGYRKGTDI